MYFSLLPYDLHGTLFARMTIISGEQCKGRSALCHIRHPTVTPSHAQMFSITAMRNGRLATQVLSHDCNTSLKIAMLFEFLSASLEQCFTTGDTRHSFRKQLYWRTET
jgi:hypothetical protein